MAELYQSMLRGQPHNKQSEQVTINSVIRYKNNKYWNSLDGGEGGNFLALALDEPWSLI